MSESAAALGSRVLAKWDTIGGRTTKGLPVFTLPQLALHAGRASDFAPRSAAYMALDRWARTVAVQTGERDGTAPESLGPPARQWA